MKLWYWLLILFAFAMLVFAIVTLWLDRPPEWFGADATSQAGQRGDYWGGHLSGLGAMAAAIFLFVAILLQRDELKAQRMELRLAREISETQAEQLTAQTQIARHSAVTRGILEVIQFRQSLVADQRTLNLLEPDGRYQFQRIERDINRTTSYLQGLLRAEALSPDERLHLEEAARIDGFDAVISSYAIVQLDVAGRPDGRLQLTLCFGNQSPFPIRRENAYFCCPREIVGERVPGEPDWVVAHRQMQPAEEFDGKIIPSGRTQRYMIRDWGPVNREHLQAAPEESFWCEVQGPGHQYKLEDGKNIKKHLLDNLRP